MRSHGFNPGHPAAVGQALRSIITDESTSNRDRVIEILELSSRHKAESLSPQNIAQLFLFVGNRCKEDPSLLQVLKQPDVDREIKRVCAIARRQIDAFDGRNIAETLRGLVFMDRRKETLGEALLARASGMIETLAPGDLVMTLGAVRLLDFDATFFCGVIPAAIDAKISDFTDREIALGAKFLAELGLSDQSRMLIDRLMMDLDGAAGESLGILAGTMRELSTVPDGYCMSIAGELSRRLTDEPEGVMVREAVEVIELLSNRGLRHDRFIESFCREMRVRVENFGVDELRSTARGFAMLQEADREFFRAIEQKALREIRDLTSTDISFIAWSFTSLGIRSDALFNRFASALEGRYGELSPSTAANIAWSFAPLDTPVARSVIAHAGRSLRAQEHDVLLERQLHIAEVAVGLTSPGNCAPAITAHAREENGRQVMNGFEAGVHDTLERLDLAGIEIRPFEIIEGLVPDFVVTVGDRKIIIECDGVRYHLTTQGTRLGRDIIQDKVFRRCGYDVVHILDTEWHTLSFAERGEYLLKQLGLERYQ